MTCLSEANDHNYNIIGKKAACTLYAGELWLLTYSSTQEYYHYAQTLSSAQMSDVQYI